MQHIIRLTIIALSLAATAAAAADAERLMRRAARYLAPLPEVMPGAENDVPERIALGRQLFFDQHLSINDTQSCASCHRLEDGLAGVDGLPTSPGARGEAGTRNSPTVLNAGFQTSQFWDARAKDLAEQAKQPILNPIEMGMPGEQAVVDKIRAMPEYRAAFAGAFPGEDPAVTYDNLAGAIAAFERTLRTPSRFDDFMHGDAAALSEAEQRGLAAFIKLDCKSCHDGPLLGGDLVEPLGKKNPYENQSDQGVYELTKDEEDRMLFKVAPLRNVALTAPYFHDGKKATLAEAVRAMAWLQLDEELDDAQVDDLVAFLQSLTDKARER